ncbi:MAG TPA: hypothetical protein VG674_05600 [Amycolatopsis sp.]|nr:hypothetical protein [Amycolatopsis sp.]
MKGPLVDEEVSVAELLVREGWGERVPPPSRSRWRMVAVMLAVVVGCGAAAVLVGFGTTTANDEATKITEMKVIEMPDRTGGAGGVSETNPPATVEGSGQQGGSTTSDDTTTAPSSPKITSILDPLNPRGSNEPSSSTQHQAPTTSGTSTAPTGTAPPSSAGSATTAPPSGTTTTPSRPRTCVLIICI